MKHKLLWVFLFVTIVVGVTEAKLDIKKLIKDFIRNIAKAVCKGTCKVKICTWVAHNPYFYQVCLVACHKGCEKLRKRKIPSNPNRPSKEITQLVLVPPPNKLSSYDRNLDSRISMNEFKAAFHKDKDPLMIKMVFHSIDKNGDKYIDCDEFRKAKLNFEKKPQC